MSIKIAEYKFNKALNTLPLVNGGYSYTYSDVDNGDNTITRTISTDAAPTSINFEYCDGLLEVYFLNISGMTSLNDMFTECYNLVSVNTADWDTSRITSMANLFVGCESLVSLDISNWVTSQVRNMSYMFTRCLSLTEIKGIENLNTANVTNMTSMFRSCSSLFNLNLSNWNTSNVTNMYQMFNSCNKLTSLDLSNWNVGKVTNMDNIFSYSSIANLNLTGWNFNSSVITSYSNYMFNNCTGLNRIIMYKSNIDSVNKIIAESPTRTADSMGDLNITGINDISQVDTTTAQSKYWNITDKMLIARYTAKASGVLPTFNEGYQYEVNETSSNGIYTVELSSDTDFTSCSFYNKTNLLTVEYLKITNNVTNMASMFDGCSSLTSVGDLSNWDVGNVTDMSYMFQDCESLTSLDLSNWDTSNVTDISNIFTNCYKLESLDLSRWDVTNLTTMYESFYECNSLKSVGDLSNWNVSKLTTTNSLFDKCWELTGVGDLSNWDTKNITDIGWMFRECHKLESSAFDSVSNWDVSSVYEMQSTFENCDNLIHLDLSNWDISNVTNMQYMFLDCQNLTELNISNWHLNSEIDTTDIFENTNVLSIVAMNNSDYDSVNKIITELSTRTSDSMGTLNISRVDDISQVDIITAESKFWNIESGEEPKPETSNLLKIGDTIINNIYIGDSQVLKICLGTVLIYEAPFK